MTPTNAERRWTWRAWAFYMGGLISLSAWRIAQEFMAFETLWIAVLWMIPLCLWLSCLSLRLFGKKSP